MHHQEFNCSRPKKQKHCNDTIGTESQHPEQKQNQDYGASIKPTNGTQEMTCEVCHQTLPRHLFPKGKFKKEKKLHNDICRQCKKNMTAERLKQPTKSQIKVGRKSDSGIKRRPNNFGYCNYVDQLFAMDCFPDIVALKAFTSAKDVSESMAAIQAACQHGLLKDDGKKNKDRKVMCLCIGDGTTPRTAVLACYLKKWECISIDPALNEEWQGVNPKGVRGLTGFGLTLEEFMVQKKEDCGTLNEKYDHLVLLCVHSHARLVDTASVPNIMARYNNIPTTLISLPCCPKFRSQKDVGRVPDVKYEDDCVFSACRRVEVWNFDYTNTFCGEVNT